MVKKQALELTAIRRIASPRLRRNVSAYLFLLPAIVFLSVVYVYPLFRLVPMSLHRIAAGQSTWVGIFICYNETKWSCRRCRII